MKRRDILQLFGMVAAGAILAPAAKAVDRKLLNSIRQNTDKEATTRYIFEQMIAKIKSENYQSRPIGFIMGELGLLLLGTAYVGGTLEGPSEQCRVDLTGLDCVTFFENILGMARITVQGRYTMNDLINEVTLTRYRGGLLRGYTSRLHYTSEWIIDNTAKKTVKDITKDLGGIIFPLSVSFMSEHPQYYAPLQNNEQEVDTIRSIEKNINSHTHYYIPKKDVKKIEQKLMTGDIIAIATNKQGLDYAHTGIIYKDRKGKARFLHASQKQKKVILDTTISSYLKSVSSHIGITVIRPLPV